MKSDTVQLDNDGPRRAKLFITLKKHKNFDTAIEKYNRIRAENDKLPNKYRKETQGAE